MSTHSSSVRSSSAGSPRRPKYAALAQSSPARSSASADSRMTSQSQLARVGGYLQERLSDTSPGRKRLPGVEALVAFLDGEETTVVSDENKPRNNGSTRSLADVPTAREQAQGHVIKDSGFGEQEEFDEAPASPQAKDVASAQERVVQAQTAEKPQGDHIPTELTPQLRTPPHTPRANTRSHSTGNCHLNEEPLSTQSQNAMLAAATNEIGRLQSEMVSIQHMVEQLKDERHHFGKGRIVNALPPSFNAHDPASEQDILDFVRKIDSLVWLKRDLPHNDDRRRDEAVFTSANLVHLGKRVQAWEDAIRRRAGI